MSLRSRWRSWIKVAALSVLAGIVAVLAVPYHLATLLAQPLQHPIGPPPEHIPLASIEFPSKSGHLLRGWFARGSGRGGVLLLHGVRSDRRSMLSRAGFLHGDGYSVMLIDLQAHGESEGEWITFGHLESLDAASAVALFRQQIPNEPIGVIGTSLGGAACVLGEEPLDVDALILEAVYPDVGTAIRNRLGLRLGAPGVWMEPVLTVQIKPRLGIDESSLRPVESITGIRAPVLIVAGEKDRRTTIEDSRRLFRAAPEPKEFWAVPGAAHVDFHRFSPAEYEARVLGFLLSHMRQAG